jgi:hypothetical protein
MLASLITSLKTNVHSASKTKAHAKSKVHAQAQSHAQVQIAAKKQDNTSTTVSPTNTQTSTNTNKPQPVVTNYGTPISDTNSQITQQPSNNNGDQSIDENDRFFNQRNIVCTQKNCVAPYGVCTNNNTVCMCTSGYANFVPAGETTYDFYCTYKQKKQIIAFLLEFFISVGVGHFYAGRILFGVFKLLVMFGPIILGILMCCTAMMKDRDSSTCMGLFVMIASCTFICGGLIWQLVDVIMFGINSYKDGNGVPLEHW